MIVQGYAPVEGTGISSVVIGDDLRQTMRAGAPRWVDDEFGGHVFGCWVACTEGKAGVVQRRIFEALGASVVSSSTDRVSPVLIPTPERLAVCADALEIPIRFEGNGSATNYAIPAQIYGSIVLNEKRHPVSVHDADNYVHDAMTMDDHMCAVAICGPELFDLYDYWTDKVDEPLGLRNLADAHDQVSFSIAQAVMSLFMLKEPGLFDQYMDEYIPHTLGGDSAHNPDYSLKIRRMITSGLARLGITDAPDVSSPPWHYTCGTCQRQEQQRHQDQSE